MTTHTQTPVSSNSGSTTVELVVLVPLLMLFVVLMFAFGRYELVEDQVRQSVGSAAAAAAVAGSASEGRQAAVDAAQIMLEATPSCADPRVVVDTTQFSAAGFVTVTVQCRVSFADLSFPGMSGSTIVEATQRAPIDPYRVVTS